MIRGMKRPVTRNNDILFNASIHNRFDVEVVDSLTGKIKQRARGYNVICDQLWTYLFTASRGSYYTSLGSYFNYIAYGTGTGTPSTSDTKLFSHLGMESASSDKMSQDVKNGVYYERMKIQLSETTAVGKNITEVGICADNSASSLCTHAMLQDMNGNNVSLNKTNTDIVNIYATVYVHYNPTGYNGAYIMPRYENNRNILRWMAGRGGNIYGANFYGTSNVSKLASDQAVDVTSVKANASAKTMTFNVGRLAAANGNIGGIAAIALVQRYDSDSSTSIHWDHPPQIALMVGEEWYPGTSIVGESVGTGNGTAVDYALDFPYASDAKVYVDGVLCEDVTVDSVPNKTSWLDIVQWIHPTASSVDHFVPAICPNVSGTSMYATGHVFYNPLHEKGIVSVTVQEMTVRMSDDLVDWVELTVGAAGEKAKTVTVPEEYQHYRFWKLNSVMSNGTYYYRTQTFTFAPFSTKAVHFASPPADGAVITADYFTKTIAKDANHVFDLSVTIQLGEYAEA